MIIKFDCMKKKIIVVAGPTASGKTALGIEIANAVGGEIISADSMQVYKGMPIATAAPTAEERSMANHHLTEFLDCDEGFSVAKWCELARVKIDEIIARGNVPVIVGGTGLFIDSLVDNIVFEDVEINTELRSRLMQRDNNSLYEELLSVDSEAAADIHPNNKKRVVRALELYYSGSGKTQQNINSRKNDNPYETLYFVIDYRDRQALYDRINQRVDKMVELGIVDEAKKALSCKLDTSAQAIGHKELAPYINGELSLEDAVDNLKKETRHYAKRQITWFKRRDNAVRLTVEKDIQEVKSFAVNKCEDFLNG